MLNYNMSTWCGFIEEPDMFIYTRVLNKNHHFCLELNSFLFVVHGSNDVYDFDTGADKNKKESVVNLLGR